MQTILIVEDKKSMADMLSRTFESQGFVVKTAYNVKEGVSFLSSDLSAVVTDLKLPDGDGIEIVKTIKENYPFIPVILMTAYGSIETAVRAVKEGAYDFITKPFDPDHLLLIVKRAIDEKGMERENIILKKEFSKFLKMPEIIGVSRHWNEIMEGVKKIARLKTTVLILGESGTGKELIAKAIHYLSPRAKEPFVAVNCAAIPKDLIENEIFGHEKGAFTGAGETKIGRFELANRGTIFLDEIGDMEMPLQSKLLRVLQENEFERVGGTKTIKVDVRVIAASNKNLQREVSEGRFREDLFYRLNVFPVVIPPLRERREDIIPLACYFISQFCRDMNKNEPSISIEAERILMGHDWKGNVRELKNVIERAVILCDGETLLPEHLSFGVEMKEKIDSITSLHEVGESAAKSAEKAQIEAVLMQTKGNKSRAAEILKVSYKTLLNKIKEYDIG
ncbi:acetoacetate metabolism regulatory protein AtoC [Dissulfurispira thermophila]|uniref:Acetoacetate metabolism regulatory protein AtoC n=2 Tax=root TaxID=1 RepID=A0A7G1H0L4_9BACT|nr:sigma-54 dependent transcriptional regulator [Dissulfurispira thermophila]BCB96108.1 acetoacetate metabolism regulatory protein AtoC [Dissulfurispira thermophila]